jgi:hypothetical protein
MTTKSISIKGLDCRSGRCAAKAVELTPGDLCRVPESGLRESRDFLTATQKSADGIVGEWGRTGGFPGGAPFTEGPNGLVGPTEQGTPQGGPLSPLLSNLVLDDLDRELERRGHRFVRYADDNNIYVRSSRARQRVMESVTRFLTGT